VLVRSVPLEGGACEEVDTGALGTLLAVFDEPGAPRAGLELPCRSGDADLWFAESPAELERAKALCGGCPVRVACLAGALQREEPWGVWGGEIFERGLVVARKRPRGRPSKADLARDAAYAAARAAASA
jgi:WhiB family transcriptional regulator, redox-sensing transcriptional regulator